MAGHGKSRGNPFVQAAIVLMLVVGMAVLFRLTGEQSLLEQPRGAAGTVALVAFGFVVLASFTIGRFVDIIRLPHITGYLLAGMLFGQGVAHFVSKNLAQPLLDLARSSIGPAWAADLEAYGRVLHDGFLFSDGQGGGTLGSLSIIKTLAVALIAMTAGGELKLDALKRGFRTIASVLAGQGLVMFALLPPAVALFGGPLLHAIPADSHPLAVGLTMGLVVAAISLATSPAATIAVVNESRAEGPVTNVVLATVVLKDVVVVVTFSVAVALASGALGIASDVALGPYLATHIGGSIVVGAALGGLVAFYLRFVGSELLLMIVAVVYAATLFASEFHLDPVLLFLTTGFTAANFSKEGDTLIHAVERLSVPVYVVFFTLAGAELHLEELPSVAPLTLGLVLLRAASIYGGVWLAGRVSPAPEHLKRHGWLGFVSQAGVAIVLAEVVGHKLGPTGAEFQRVLISAVALNEIVGPMLLKLSLERAGETGKKAQGVSDHGLSSEPPPPADAPQSSGSLSIPPEPIKTWPPPSGAPLSPGGAREVARLFRSEALTKEVQDLQAQLEAIALGVAKGPVQREHNRTEQYLRSLRREFLRGHRRLSVVLRTEADKEGAEAPAIAQILHREQANLVTRWRVEVLDRATTVRHAEWSPGQLVETLDRIVESCPEWILAPYEEVSFQSHHHQGVLRTVRREALRARRMLARVFRTELQRRIPFRALVRYHLYGATPVRLEELAAYLVRAEVHLLNRARELFEDVIGAYEHAIDAEAVRDGAVSLSDEELGDIRTRVDERLDVSLREARHMALGTSETLAAIFGRALDDLVDDLQVAGTLDLAARTRRSSKVFHDRLRALNILSDDLEKVRHTVGDSYRLLAMELELLGLEARVRDVLDEQGASLTKSIRGRAHMQAGRVKAALADMLRDVDGLIQLPEHTGESLAKELKQLAVPLRKATEEAVEVTGQLHEQLSDDNTLAPLLDSLRRATGSLSEVYEVPAKALRVDDNNRLPEPSASLEVPFRALVGGHFEGTIAPELAHVTQIVASQLHPLVTSLQELSRLIDLKLDLAVAELDAVLDEPIHADTKKVLQELLVAGFQRNEELLAAHTQAAAGWGPTVDEGLRQHTLRGLTALRRKLVHGGLSQLRIDVMRRKAAGRRLIRRAEELPSLLEQIRVAIRTSTVAVVGEERLERWWRRIGLPGGVQTTPTPLDFQRPSAQLDLPLVYRRLFSAEALDLRALRIQEIARARNALVEAGRAGKSAGRGQRAPRDGGLRTVAFVGPEGVGKGAMLQAAVRASGLRSVKRIHIDKPVDRDQVDEWLAELQPGQLVVVSGFHWMLSLAPGGFEPLRRFLDGILNDRGQCAFVMSADEVVWNMAKQVVPLASVFAEVIPIAPLSSDELEAVVMSRHRLSGAGVEFERQVPQSALEELVVKGAGQLRRPYQAFFRSLHDVSGGFVREAFALWLVSINRMGRDFVHMGTLPPAPERALRRLPEDVLLQLVQLARQGWGCPASFAALYRVRSEDAKALLVRLSRLGLVVREDDNHYTIAPHLRGAVFRTLRERGWV